MDASKLRQRIRQLDNRRRKLLDRVLRPGPNLFDALGALERWVKDGIAPDKIIAYHCTSGVVDHTRPVCPYPEVATWTGTGSTDGAANFVCEIKGLDRAEEASNFGHGLEGRNNARRKQAK